nr:hypothetical protein [Tanacetum cinerariifolium]
MQEDDSEVQEVVKVVTTAKLITKVVTFATSQVSAASATISAAKPSIPAAAQTSRKEMEEEDREVLKSINETPVQKAAKRRKL